MMARSRNIKPSFFKNEDLVELPFEYRLLFIGLWTLADREGRLEDRPKRIKMELFPADDVNIELGLLELERFGFIERYEASGTKVVNIVNFTVHQSPHHTEKQSGLPSANECLTDDSPLNNGYSTDSPQNHLRENPPDSLIPDSLIPESLIMNPDSPTHTPPANIESQDDIPAVCLALRGMGVSISDERKALPEITALLNRGATLADFTAGLEIAHGKGKGFGYALGVVKGRLDDAQNAAVNPRQRGNGKMSREDWAAVPDASLAEYVRSQHAQNNSLPDDGKTLEAV